VSTPSGPGYVAWPTLSYPPQWVNEVRECLKMKNFRRLRKLGVPYYDPRVHHWFDFPDDFKLELFHNGTYALTLKPREKITQESLDAALNLAPRPAVTPRVQAKVRVIATQLDLF